MDRLKSREGGFNEQHKQLKSLQVDTYLDQYTPKHIPAMASLIVPFTVKISIITLAVGHRDEYVHLGSFLF